MNIIHGHSAAGAFKQAFHIPGEDILVFTDVLSCGPLTRFSDVQSWQYFRQEYWNGLGKDNAFEYGTYSFNEFQRDFYHNFAELEYSKEVDLWIGTGLSDQLLLVFLLSLFDEVGFDPKTLHVFQFEKLDRHNLEIQSLGMLNPEQITDHPEPYTPSKEHITIAKTAWQAISAASPDAFLQFIRTENHRMPLLGRAMKYLLFRYPKSSNGLSFWDEKLLEYTEKHGPNTARIIGYTLGDCMDSLDLVGDFYLFNRLKNMGRLNLAAPLVEANAFNLPMRETKIKITPNGKQALQDKVNAIMLNGIDDWVGGVHLDSSTGSVWLRENETLFCQQL